MTLERQSASFELTLSLFAVIVLLLGFSVWVMIPETKTYLQLQEEAASAVEQTGKFEMEYDRLYAQKELIEADAAALTERFENSIDSEALGKWIKTLWKDIAVVSEEPGGVFRIKSTAKKPGEFYRFIDQLDAAPWVLGLEMPIVMQSENGSIDITFSLRPATHATVHSPLQK